MNNVALQLSSGRSVVEKALVLESHFAVRLGLLDKLHHMRFAEEVLEAKSIGDGLGILREEEIDACFIGPGISIERPSRY